MDSVEKYRNYMLENNLLLIYEGELNQKILLSMVALLEKRMQALSEINFVRKKIVNIIIEALQNVIKYEDPVTEGSNEEMMNNNPFFMVGRQEEKYTITWGNSVHKMKISKIKDKLEYIATLDRTALNDFYQEKVKDLVEEGLEIHRNSAGLGFIDITKKSGENIQYDFKDINNDYAYFYQSVGIKRPRRSRPMKMVKTA